MTGFLRHNCSRDKKQRISLKLLLLVQVVCTFKSMRVAAVKIGG